MFETESLTVEHSNFPVHVPTAPRSFHFALKQFPLTPILSGSLTLYVSQPPFDNKSIPVQLNFLNCKPPAIWSFGRASLPERNSRVHTILSFPLLTSFFFSSRRRHTRSTRDWSSDVCSSHLASW